jgi:hypothetical protein
MIHSTHGQLPVYEASMTLLMLLQVPSVSPQDLNLRPTN